MARRSEIEARIKALQDELDGADTDDEIWIKEGDGPEIKVSGKRATTVLNRFSKLWEDEGDDGEDAGDAGEDEPPKREGLFKPRGK